MKPLDDAVRRLRTMDFDAKRLLSDREYSQYVRMDPTERAEQLSELTTAPIARFSVVNDVFFRARWVEALTIAMPADRYTLLEVATGDADMIPQAIARAFPGSTYITANMNRALNESLLSKTEGLPLTIRLLADDAANIEAHLGSDHVDVIAFQHAANDIMQAILCAQEGIDTVYADWMATLPKMIDLVRNEFDKGTFESSVKPHFVELVRRLIRVLRPGGAVVINHYMFQLDLDWGYPPDLWENIVEFPRKIGQLGRLILVSGLVIFGKVKLQGFGWRDHAQ